MSSSSAYSAQRATYTSDENHANSPANTAQPNTAMPNPDDPQHPRASSSTASRSSVARSRQQNPQQQLSTIEKSVTHLLVATKQLLETLTMWSRGTANEGEVSDVYVRLGYEFNIACRAFNAINVDTSDLGPVPDLLRGILEDTLSQEASQASLDKYLPRIRDIIINLLHGLKKKQQRLRQRTGSVREGTDGRQIRQTSVASNLTAESNLTQQLEGIPSRTTSTRSFAQTQGNGDFSGPDLPPRTTSVAGGRASPRRQNFSPQNSLSQPPTRDVIPSEPASTSSNPAVPSIPVIVPYPEENTMPTNQSYDDVPYESDQHSSEPPKPPSKQNDALSALQRSGDLERRASRRFSSYQISKHLGPTMNGIPSLPPAQHSPVPNRGRDVRESMSAVRSRGSMVNSQTKTRTERSRGRREASPKPTTDINRIAEESTSQIDDLPLPGIPPTGDELLDSPMIKTPEDKLGSYPFPPPGETETVSATVNGPMEEAYVPETITPVSDEKEENSLTRNRTLQSRHTPPPSQFIPDGSPQSGKELTLFLQYKSKIKKFVLPDGGNLSIPRLQLAFIEKFAWNTHNNGVDLPEIYIQDPVSGVRHELEDLSDIKERSVLVLNVEALDEVKRHIDDGIGGLRRIVEGIRNTVEGQQSALQRVSDRQQETAKDIASLAVVPAASDSSSAPPLAIGQKLSPQDRAGQLNEVQTLRRDLAVIRQVYSSFASDMKASMSTIRSKAATVKKAAATAAVPEMDENAGRAYVNKGKKSLGDESEKIVNRVDDLQDLVEDLRKDVVTRGVRPLPRQLETVSKDISTATQDLKKMQEYLRKEKPIWTKIWERELQVVCDDRDLLTMQEELAADLEDDLEKAAATFALVEQATKQQNLANPAGQGQTTQRSTSRSLNPIAMDRGADPHKAKDDVLGEVRALQPNHESRLEAIERAERSRQRELESRKGGEFQRELGNFVEEGKLKKSGGIEEVERVRKQREDATRREIWERQQARLAAQAEKEAAAAAAQAQQAQDQANGVTHEDQAESTQTPDAEADTAHEAHADPASHEQPGETGSPEPDFVEASEQVTSAPTGDSPPAAS
ncbi:Hypothetical protein R9X50_00400600 [Acrodontium crateriforme]|uniref:Actin interacting protein 3 C-terminal domain-containing protein n=1 Tax=Acrodontium crateriforme TaxID=150365 RepID=A0AAQ3RAD5_9PEZI|nr:Hypothetical protein R9X50_00400600 [Acrodontium crateriforme]